MKDAALEREELREELLAARREARAKDEAREAAEARRESAEAALQEARGKLGVLKEEAGRQRQMIESRVAAGVRRMQAAGAAAAGFRPSSPRRRSPGPGAPEDGLAVLRDLGQGSHEVVEAARAVIADAERRLGPVPTVLAKLRSAVEPEAPVAKALTAAAEAIGRADQAEARVVQQIAGGGEKQEAT